MKDRVLQEIERIEGTHCVRVLLAVESGSRAWGFASPDSDFDVRFVYVHERNWYLSVFESRDVIEEMLPGDLDVSGWDLRKTLRLFSKCNLALNEWLGSPVTYSEVAGFRHQLAKLIPEYFNPIAALHHYRRMAERSLAENFSDGQIRIKKIFYVLRPLFACRWIEQRRSQPPTEFSRLVAQDWIANEEKEWVAGLLQQKASAIEAEPIELSEQTASKLMQELERYKTAAEALQSPTKSHHTDLDDLLRSWVMSS